MNVFTITSKTPFALSQEQQQQCLKSGSTECLAYINANDIKVTTCGTRIHADNVFPQKDTMKVTLIEYPSSPTVQVHATIGSQPVIALANKELLDSQRLFSWCSRRHNMYTANSTEPMIYHTDCKHVKLVIDSKDITIAN